MTTKYWEVVVKRPDRAVTYHRFHSPLWACEYMDKLEALVAPEAIDFDIRTAYDHKAVQADMIPWPAMPVRPTSMYDVLRRYRESLPRSDYMCIYPRD